MSSKQKLDVKSIQSSSRVYGAPHTDSLDFAEEVRDVKPLVQQRYFFHGKRAYLSSSRQNLRRSVRASNLEALWIESLPLIESRDLVTGLERVPGRLKFRKALTTSAVLTWHLDLHACSKERSKQYLAEQILRIEADRKPAFLQVICGKGQGILRRCVSSWLWATPHVVSLCAEGEASTPDAVLKAGLLFLSGNKKVKHLFYLP